MIPEEVRVLKPGLENGSGLGRKLFLAWFDPGGRTGWCVMRINLAVLQSGGLRAVCLAHPDPEIFSFAAGYFSGPEPYQAELMLALLRGTWLHGEGIWDAGDESDLFIAGIEKFNLRQLGGDELLSPVRVPAAFHAISWRSLFIPVLWQTSSDAFNTVDDGLLRRLNLWTGPAGKNGEHQRDATKHAATCARKAMDPRWIEEISKKMKWLRE